MLGVVDLGVFIAGTVAVVLLPGPNSLYVLTVETRSGVRRGYAGACGVFTGDAVLMLLTALGVKPAGAMQPPPQPESHCHHTSRRHLRGDRAYA